MKISKAVKRSKKNFKRRYGMGVGGRFVFTIQSILIKKGKNKDKEKEK
jgi:hypothetical protein